MGGRKRPASALGDSPSTTRVKGGAVRTGARRCGFPECGKTAKPGGFCISHGGGKKCAVQGCTTSVVSRGFCVAHGGGKRCQQPDCSKSAQTGGFCWIHGGGKKCGFEGCRKRAQSGGACISHGGGKRCRIDGCNKVVQYEGLCVGHGGYRRCLSINCARKALANSYCQLHGGRSQCSVATCSKKAVRGGTCGEHKLLAASATQSAANLRKLSNDQNDGGQHPNLGLLGLTAVLKTPELRDADISLGLTMAPSFPSDVTSSPVQFGVKADRATTYHRSGSVSSTASDAGCSPTVRLQSSFARLAHSDSGHNSPASHSHSLLPGIRSIQSFHDSPWGYSRVGADTMTFTPPHKQTRLDWKMPLPPLVSEHMCCVANCGRFAKRNSLCLLHSSSPGAS